MNHSVNVLGKNVHAMSKVWFYGGVAMKKEQIDIPSYVICCLRRLKFDINREIEQNAKIGAAVRNETNLNFQFATGY